MGLPGPANYDPLSKFTPARTPGVLGRRDSADPGALTSRGETPGILGLNDDSAFDASRLVDPMDFDYLLRHRELKSKLVESVQLADLKLNDRQGLWKQVSIWSVAGAVVFRVSELFEDMDGSPRAYHPPTDASWSGHGPGLGKDYLGNAVGVPGVTKYAHSKDEKDWPLTAGCQLFRDLNKARGLAPKAAAVAQPAPGAPASPDQAGAAKAAQDLAAIFQKYGVSKLSELEKKSQSAVCVLYVDGRPKSDSQADWKHVTRWAGIKTDRSGAPVVRASGPNQGFYIPAVTPDWADAEQHPWVVLNPPQDDFGVKLTNSAVVIKNGESPTIAYGMVGDVGPRGHLGEVSRKMLDELHFTGAASAGDYIAVLFPKPVSPADLRTEKQLSAIQSDAQAAFEAWTWEGRSGIDLIKELFPPPEQYHRVLTDFANAKQYLSPYIDQMMLKLR